MVPVHAAVKTLYSSGDAPQLTSSAGNGYIMVPGLQFCFILGDDMNNNVAKVGIFFLTSGHLVFFFLIIIGG